MSRCEEGELVAFLTAAFKTALVSSFCVSSRLVWQLCVSSLSAAETFVLPTNGAAALSTHARRGAARRVFARVARRRRRRPSIGCHLTLSPATKIKRRETRSKRGKGRANVRAGRRDDNDDDDQVSRRQRRPAGCSGRRCLSSCKRKFGASSAAPAAAADDEEQRRAEC